MAFLCPSTHTHTQSQHPKHLRDLSISPQGAYYTQPVYAAQPHVIHHTTVVQPNSIPSAIYPAPVAAPRTNGVAMGMVAGTTMAMSAGEGSPHLHATPRLQELRPAGTHRPGEHTLQICLQRGRCHMEGQPEGASGNLAAGAKQGRAQADCFCRV